MAGNFKPTFWSKYCQTELKKDLVLANWCDYKYDGEVKGGARLKIVGASRPTIQTYKPGKDLEIEKLGDNAQYLDIDQFKAFAFEVDDVDRAQSQEGYLETEFDEAKTALAEDADAYVGTMAKDALVSMTSNSIDISAEASPLTSIDNAMIKLYKNNVSSKAELAADLNAEHLTLIRSKLASLFTDNVEYIKRGAVGKYNNCYLRMSNNLYNDKTDDYEMVRTKKAIAFANGVEKVEKCRPSKRFSDVIKGLHVYGAKLVRPKELYVIKVH
mgnify:FL=1|jgi:hypothetical protein